MNRQQFMKAMEVHLRPMDPFERAELLADYDQHFELGLSEGRQEEEIARELGQPEEIAKEALGDRYDAHTPGSDAFYAPTYQEMRSPRNSTKATRNFFTAIGLIFLNLILGIPLGLTLWSVWLTVASLSLLILAPVAAVVDFVFLGQLDKAEIFVAIGAFGVGILFALASKYVFRAFKIITLQYIKWNKNMMKGDVSA
ncbi:HAAS signaling domain-containing protein [Paenibacillus sp. SAF-068]|uniref:HAAS signaling domain-containing protein n=1 Tax=Paenibacillus sp. SAF-068 TaxID=3436864 RepID=UPI003F7F7274